MLPDKHNDEKLTITNFDCKNCVACLLLLLGLIRAKDDKKQDGDTIIHNWWYNNYCVSFQRH